GRPGGRCAAPSGMLICPRRRHRPPKFGGPPGVFNKREDCMKYSLLFSAALLTALSQAQPAAAQTNPIDRVKQGVEALGGENALRAIKTIVQKADAKHWEPGQSNSVNGESRFLGDSTLTVTVDFGSPVRARFDWDRDMKYPAVEKLKYSEIRYPTYGAV